MPSVEVVDPLERAESAFSGPPTAPAPGLMPVVGLWLLVEVEEGIDRLRVPEWERRVLEGDWRMLELDPESSRSKSEPRSAVFLFWRVLCEVLRVSGVLVAPLSESRRWCPERVRVVTESAGGCLPLVGDGACSLGETCRGSSGSLSSRRVWSW